MPENKSETLVGVKRDNSTPALLRDIPPQYEPLAQQPYDSDFGLRLATPVPETHGIVMLYNYLINKHRHGVIRRWLARKNLTPEIR